MKFFKALSIFLVILSLIFIFQNLEMSTVRFLKQSFTAPLALIISVTLLVGFFVGIIFTWPELSKTRREAAKIYKQNEFLKKKLDDSAISYETEGLGAEGNNSF